MCKKLKSIVGAKGNPTWPRLNRDDITTNQDVACRIENQIPNDWEELEITQTKPTRTSVLSIRATKRGRSITCWAADGQVFLCT